MEHMVALVGEQPIPNLIAVRHYSPRKVTWVFTDGTEGVVARLKRLVNAQHVDCRTAPFDMSRVEADLKRALGPLGPDRPCFNLTGGTKAMGYAAFNVARQWQAPFFYLQSEGGYVVYEYQFGPGGSAIGSARPVGSQLFGIGDYLEAHVGAYGHIRSTRADQAFVEAVAQALKAEVDELDTHVSLGPALELDLVCRRGNTVAVAELKTGGKAQEKRGIDQLVAATEPRYLGSYTRRLLITDREPGSNLQRLAHERRIQLIVLRDWRREQPADLSPTDVETLRSQVRQAVG